MSKPKRPKNLFSRKKPDIKKTRMRTIWVTEPTRPFSEVYSLGKQLGQPGQFGHAYQCVKKSDKKALAVKVISKSRFYHIKRESRNKYLHAMQSEIAILRTLTHEYIVILEDVYEDKKNLWIVMEECKGGELFERIVSKGHFSEREAARTIRMVLEALQYMHDYHRVVHCDLKPDNVLFANKNDNSPVKIIDFGMSKVLPRLKSLNELVGTPYYTAPEILSGSYNHGADVWSVGVIMYVMLFGYPPFYVDPVRYGKNEAKAIYAKIKRGFQPIIKPGYGPWFPQNMKVSADARDLMARLLEMDVARRLTAREALQSRWIRGSAPRDNIPREIVSKIANFSNDCNFKIAVIQLFRKHYQEMHPHQFRELKKTFKKLDTDGDGMISYQEFENGLLNIQELSLTKKQIKAMFNQLNVKDNKTKIGFEDLLDAAVHDYLVAADERLYAAFRDLDEDDDGWITTEELMKRLREFDPLGEWKKAVELIDENSLDKNGRIDYEDFLRVLHPNFNETPVNAVQLMNTTH